MKVREITPKKLLCGAGPCPAVFKTDRETIIIVGSIPANNDLPQSIRRKIGRGEVAIEVPKSLLEK
jgi:hypothetical protein